MTHGCIKIIDVEGKIVWLHTTHTGQHVRRVVENVFNVVARERSYLGKDLPLGKTGIEAVQGAMSRDGRLACHFEYAGSVAALIIAAGPMMYEVVKFGPATPKGLATWSGADRPTILKCCDGKWDVLYDLDLGHVHVEYNIAGELVDALQNVNTEG